MYYYIIGNFASSKYDDVKEYCFLNGLEENMIIKTKAAGKKFFELQSTANYKVYHNTFLTDTQLEERPWIEHIAQLKSGEYTEHFVHLKEISEGEYRNGK